MASNSLSGHLLCAIPYPEPRQVTDNIRLAHPNLKITFIQTKFLQFVGQAQQVLSGMTTTISSWRIILHLA